MFSYGCVHCYRFDPAIEAWRVVEREGVSFRRLPAVFGKSWEPLARWFYTADVLGERMEQLRELFPEAFDEGQIDLDRLRNTLGDFVGEGRERYGLSWAGKADAIRAIQAPSVGTLVPSPDVPVPIVANVATASTPNSTSTVVVP